MEAAAASRQRRRAFEHLVIIAAELQHERMLCVVMCKPPLWLSKHVGCLLHLGPQNGIRAQQAEQFAKRAVRIALHWRDVDARRRV